MSIYEKLGVQTLINASETYTNLGGSLMDPRTLEAMREAGQHFVSLTDLQSAVNARAAELTRNEAAFITTGASGGVVLAAVSCMCGTDEAMQDRIPHTEAFPRSEVLVYDGPYLSLIPYWRLIGLTGAVIRRVPPTVEAMRQAVNGRTAAVFLFPGKLYEPGIPSCEETIPMLKRLGIPVVVDAAAQLPPVSNLWYYTRELGADLCVFSGGKHIRGPQSTGLVVGRRELIEGCRLSGCPNPRIGRAYKTGKEELCGFITALEIFVTEGGEELYRRQAERLKRLADRLKRQTPEVEITFLRQGRLGTEQPLLHVLLPKGKTGAGCNRFTRSLPQPVDVGFYGDEFHQPPNLIFLNAYNLREDEVDAVADAVSAYAAQACPDA